MSIDYPRLVSRGRTPRNALWCRASVRAVFGDPTARLTVVVGDMLVPAADHVLDDGRISVRARGAWRWPNDEPDAVGELALVTDTMGMSVIGWWSPVPGGSPRLTMDVAGLTLWSGLQRVSTEEHARIHAVLSD